MARVLYFLLEMYTVSSISRLESRDKSTREGASKRSE